MACKSSDMTFGRIGPIEMANKVHPDLLEQLSNETPSQLQAVILLRGPGQRLDASPESISKMADEVLDRVAREVGHDASRTNVLKNLSTVIVQADQAFLRVLVAQPEVLSAQPNVVRESVSIEPIEE
jgi:hypothetical protein